jgi:hypothetical protein
MQRRHGRNGRKEIDHSIKPPRRRLLQPAAPLHLRPDPQKISVSGHALPVNPVFATAGSPIIDPSVPPVTTLRPLRLPHLIMSHDNPTGSPAPDLNDPQFNSLSPYNRTQFFVANGLVIPLADAPPSAGTLTPVTYLLSQPALAQAPDIATAAYGVPHEHDRTAIIMHRTSTPMPLGSVLPTSDEMPLFPTASAPPLGSVPALHPSGQPPLNTQTLHPTTSANDLTTRIHLKQTQIDALTRGIALHGVILRHLSLGLLHLERLPHHLPPAGRPRTTSRSPPVPKHQHSVPASSTFRQ